MNLNKCLSLSILIFILGCSSAQHHRQQVNNENVGKLTVGTVQKEIKVGMSGADVAVVLGSPNIVTTDENRREVWIYDKISTEVAYSKDSGGVASLIFGAFGVGSGALGAAPSASYSASSGAASKTQKTLTVVIKFDQSRRVRDFAYHTSAF